MHFYKALSEELLDRVESGIVDLVKARAGNATNVAIPGLVVSGGVGITISGTKWRTSFGTTRFAIGVFSYHYEAVMPYEPGRTSSQSGSLRHQKAGAVVAANDNSNRDAG